MKYVFIFLVTFILIPCLAQEKDKEFKITVSEKIEKTKIFVIHEKKGDLHLSNELFNALINENINAVLLGENEQRPSDNTNDIDIKYGFTTAFTVIGLHKVIKNLDIRIFDKDKLIASYNYVIRRNKAKNNEEIVIEFIAYLKSILKE